MDVQTDLLLGRVNVCWYYLTQRGFDRQRFAGSLVLDYHALHSETSYTVASMAAALNLKDKDKKK